MESPRNLHRSKEGQGSTLWGGGLRKALSGELLHANHWACLCLTTVSRIGGRIPGGTATGLGACAVAPVSQFPFLIGVGGGEERVFLPAPAESLGTSLLSTIVGRR